jgi:hypothetical protein
MAIKMPSKLNQLLERRAKLQTVASTHRVALSHQMQFWQVKLHVVDRVFSVVTLVKRHPVLILVGSGLLAWLRPLTLARYAIGALAGIQSLKQVREWLVK